MKHTPTDSQCKLFFKEHFVELVDHFTAALNNYHGCIHVHDDTVNHPMSDRDFLTFVYSLREFSDLIVEGMWRYCHTHPEVLELLKAEKGHAGRTINAIMNEVIESIKRANAQNNDLDQAEDEV